MVNHHFKNQSDIKDSRMTLSSTLRDEPSGSDSNESEVEGPKNDNPWFVYIAQVRTGRFYVGISNNPEQRIIKHNRNKGARFAQEQGPFKLVYVSKSFPNKSEARKREIQVKGWRREKKINLINGKYM